MSAHHLNDWTKRSSLLHVFHFSQIARPDDLVVLEVFSPVGAFQSRQGSRLEKVPQFKVARVGLKIVHVYSYSMFPEKKIQNPEKKSKI